MLEFKEMGTPFTYLTKAKCTQLVQTKLSVLLSLLTDANVVGLSS